MEISKVKFAKLLKEIIEEGRKNLNGRNVPADQLLIFCLESYIANYKSETRSDEELVITFIKNKYIIGDDASYDDYVFKSDLVVDVMINTNCRNRAKVVKIIQRFMEMQGISESQTSCSANGKRGRCYRNVREKNRDL